MTRTFPSRRDIAIGLASLPLAACTRARGLTAEPLSFWGMSYEGDYSPHLAASFTERTGIPVETQSLPWTAAHEKLLTAFAGGSLPDVLMLPNGWVGEFAMVGAIRRISDAALLAHQFPGVLDTVQRQGVNYAVPWSLAPQVQFYRRDLLEEAGYEGPPTNWADWRAMGRAIKRRRPDGYAFLMLLNWWDALFTFLGQTGSSPLRENDTRGNFRTPEAEAALAFYLSLFAEGPRAARAVDRDPGPAFGLRPGVFRDLSLRSLAAARSPPP